MKKILFASMMLISSVSMAQTPEEAGKGLYVSKGCIGCHGPAGVSANPSSFPKLAGLEKAHIVEQLVAFKNYTRRNPMMNGMAAALSDDEMASIAAYLAAQGQ